MEPLRLKQQKPAEDIIECWDDDDDFVVEGDDLSFRTSTTATGAAPRRRDSTSSHLSFRSDLDSLLGEERHVNINDDDERSTLDAIAAAQHAGIPLPQNVPSSALTGGTIKRLGGRRIQKIIQDDWENDLEIPEASNSLEIKPADDSNFPETLRQVSIGSVQGSPTRVLQADVGHLALSRPSSSKANVPSALTQAINLDKFKDSNDDDDFFGDGSATIKVSKTRQPPKPVSFITPPTPQKTKELVEDNFEQDLELPSDGKLQLSAHRDIPKTPSTQSEDLDWGEGSLGTRYGGTHRDGRFTRSSSAALSPSLSSSMTAESEDETFDGLLLPVGPLDFKERLQRRKQSPSPSRLSIDTRMATSGSQDSAPQLAQPELEKNDMLEGLDIGDGDVFDAGKLTLHRNIQIKETRVASPHRPKAAISLTFTNKGPQTRLPRLSHDRSHSTSLEPVSESGGPIQQRARRSQSRLSHSAQSSVSSVPTPVTATAPTVPPATPRRRELGTRSSFSSLRTDAQSTNTQLLRQKRSLPAVRSNASPAKVPVNRSERPPSRSEATRPQSGMRPKTPVERLRAVESPVAQYRRGLLPFGPSGATQTKSQNMPAKTIRQFRRYDSENAIETRPGSRSLSRAGLRSPSPQRYRVAADTWERLSRPKNKKKFGDGHELDGFDDLPTSKESETKFLKQPTTNGIKVGLRNKLHQSVFPERTFTPSPTTGPQSPAKLTATPRFARDTAASRIARETSLANRVPMNGPLSNIASQRGTQLANRVNFNSQVPQVPAYQDSVRSKKSKRSQQQKPHLISNLNAGKESKVVNGMFYNADTFRWEGNENALNAFDSPTSIKTRRLSSSQVSREKELATPRPALITNISATQGVQVVGGMVFDPQNMCWLKIGQLNNTQSEAGDTLNDSNMMDDEDDVFKDIPDLEEATGDDKRDGRVSDVKDDWMVGEEFDVGPEFVRRQREEEDRWRKKCEKWIGRGARDRDTWRWTIRELVSQFDELPV